MTTAKFLFIIIGTAFVLPQETCGQLFGLGAALQPRTASSKPSKGTGGILDLASSLGKTGTSAVGRVATSATSLGGGALGTTVGQVAAVGAPITGSAMSSAAKGFWQQQGGNGTGAQPPQPSPQTQPTTTPAPPPQKQSNVTQTQPTQQDQVAQALQQLQCPSSQVPPGIPVPAYVFSVFAMVYGCETSLVFAEFVKEYKAKTLPVPTILDNDPVLKNDETWLKVITQADPIHPAPVVTSVQEAETKVLALNGENLHTVLEGEHKMPFQAKLFYTFVKYLGCADAKLEDYKKFNTLTKAEFDKVQAQGTKYPSFYFLSKASVILAENFKRT